MDAPARDMRYETTCYRPELWDSIVSLFGLTRTDQLAAAYLDWKYTRNPYIETPLIYLVTRGDEIVGMRGAYGTKWEIGAAAGEDGVVVPCFGDLVIAPEHRDRGLVTEIMRMALRDLCDRGYRGGEGKTAS